MQSFIARWKSSGASERANFQPFLIELCDLLGVPRPEPAGAMNQRNAYGFERAVTFHNPDGSTSTGFIDLYKRGCFVCEAKQGSDPADKQAALFAAPAPRPKRGAAVRGTRAWAMRMLEAFGQASQYVRALPAKEGNPPFILVVDVGHSIEVYSDFSRSGKTYVPFPDARSHRIGLDQLQDDEIRRRLRLIWTEPMQLDPSRRSATVTREVAGQLARLAKSLEASGHAPQAVASFLMRAIFTMFAEDVRLIPEGRFTELLEELRQKPEIFPAMLRALWRDMNDGGFSAVLKANVLRFNGGLFANTEALPLDRAQLDLLIEASHADWRDVEPAIFGTLLERALDPRERHKLGAHYTPRAYVERLVMPTIIEPLRDDWEAVKVAAVRLASDGKDGEAIAEVRDFHQRLCNTRVLDPACGSGNFLYVTLEHMKRLEGEVLDALHEFGEAQMPLITVDPHQLLGIEVNPRAAAIADLVLWIGYLQWHFRTRGEALPAEPVLHNFHNIECRDAVLAYDRVENEVDEQGEAVTRWDGRTMKRSAVTGEEVPDETARVAVMKYVNPRQAEWPAADFIIGNPPFIGPARMRSVLGDGYTEALRKTYKDVPESSDFVMYWWEQAANLARQGKVKRFGLIATNSLRQTFNRRVVQSHLAAKNPLSLIFAIPDHPWVDSADGAAVRISMTVGEAGEREGVLYNVTKEEETDGEGIAVELAKREGKIFADLTVGADVANAQPLKANEQISNRGVVLHGAGFIISPQQAEQLGLNRIAGLEKHIRQYRNGRDLTSNPRDVLVIDLFGLEISEVRIKYPEVFQWIFERVKPERDQNRDQTFRDKWWVFGRPRPELRQSLEGLNRFIATVETSKHRFFMFLDTLILPDNKLVNIALDDAFYFGVLSSRIHVTWALAAGSRLGVGNDPVYVKTTCFDTFPFPDCDEAQKARIRELGEQLDAHRKRQQAAHPQLTITEMYNVLDKLRAGESLNDKDRRVHEQGLVSVLRQLHDELDQAVFAAYGWPAALADEVILERLVSLNRQRADEERRGHVRWLRPEFQNPQRAAQTAFAADVAVAARAAKSERAAWPRTLAEQARAVRAALAAQNAAVTAAELARRFKAARVERVTQLLETLCSLGQAREIAPGQFVA
ncbi:MAG TPA: DNA methyltransferase [Blastocatellia bacterium]|nr:DNA methyltransferase [Blastocatellia bacterium]